MKIIILGAGGIGSLVGAMLCKQNEVVLVGRKQHVEKINSDGLEITGCINENFKVKAAQEIKEIDSDDLIILTTKAQDIEDSLKPVKGLIKKSNTIFVLQNGLGNEDVIKEIVDCKIIRGVITTATNFIRPGLVECNITGEISLQNSKHSEEIKNYFQNVPIKVVLYDCLKKKIWTKLIYNCVINPLTAIFKFKNNELSKNKNLIENILDELLLVAEKEGLNFDKNDIINNMSQLIKDAGGNTSSMLQDIQKGRKTEIDFLNGKIVELAKKHNLEVPINETLVGLVKYLEK